MKEFIQSAPHVLGTSGRTVFKNEFSRRPEDFCDFLTAKARTVQTDQNTYCSLGALLPEGLSF